MVGRDGGESGKLTEVRTDEMMTRDEAGVYETRAPTRSVSTEKTKTGGDSDDGETRTWAELGENLNGGYKSCNFGLLRAVFIRYKYNSE